MMTKFRVQVPEQTLKALPEQDGPDALTRGLELFMGLVDRLKTYGAPGIHLFVIVDTNGACSALEKLSHR